MFQIKQRKSKHEKAFNEIKNYYRVGNLKVKHRKIDNFLETANFFSPNVLEHSFDYLFCLTIAA